MKKRIFCVIVAVIAMVAISASALSAGFAARTWTGKPEKFLLVTYGYYCTAAQNLTMKGDSDFADVSSYDKNKVCIATDSGKGNSEKVANSKMVKPYSGYASCTSTNPSGSKHTDFKASDYD